MRLAQSARQKASWPWSLECLAKTPGASDSSSAGVRQSHLVWWLFSTSSFRLFSTLHLCLIMPSKTRITLGPLPSDLGWIQPKRSRVRRLETVGWLFSLLPCPRDDGSGLPRRGQHCLLAIEFKFWWHHLSTWPFRSSAWVFHSSLCPLNLNGNFVSCSFIISLWPFMWMHPLFSAHTADWLPGV